MFKNFFSEFKKFIEKGSAIDMAVGIIVGSVMTGVVNSLVKDVLMPPIGLLIGGVDFSQLFVVIGGANMDVAYNTVEAAHAAGATTLNIGLFLNSIISFIITMFAIFIFVKLVNRVRGTKPATTHACKYCKMSVDLSATKCPYCCSVLSPVKVKENTEKGHEVLSKIANKIKKISK